MFQTLTALLLMVIATLLLPVWAQILLFLAGAFFLRFPLIILIPAVLSDALYAPGEISLEHFKMTLIAGAVVVMQWLLATKTRAPHLLYGLEKK